MLTDDEIDRIINASRDADEGPTALVRRVEAATLASSSAAREDAERLDWLDRMNAALNTRYGTVYGWKLVLSPNVTRLMAESPFRSEMASIDLHDSAGRGVRSCREAIDAAMKDGARSATKGEGAG